MALALPFNPGPRTRKVLRILGFVLLALVTFVFALQLTFPYGRVKAKIIEALSPKYDVMIGSVDRGIMPGSATFKAVTLRTRPEKAGDPVTTFYIERLKVSVGLLALVRATASVDIDAKIGSGHIAGTIELSKRRTVIDIQGSGLPSVSLPMKEAIGLPMSGKVGFSIVLDLPTEKSKSGKVAANWQKATGKFGFDCPSGCTFGDGKAKLKPKLKNARSQAFAEDGIDFGKISVDSLTARVTVKDGRMELTKFDTKSQDGELHVDFELTLEPDINASMVAGCLRFRGSDGLQKREPKTHAALSTTGAKLGPDDLFHIRLDGRFKEMKRLAQSCGPALKSANMDDPGGGGEPSRPNLTVQPDESLKTNTPTVTPPPPPPAPTPVDAAIDAHDAAKPATPPGEAVPAEGANGAEGADGTAVEDPAGEPVPINH